jgi:hypothetical protein
MNKLKEMFEKLHSKINSEFADMKLGGDTIILVGALSIFIVGALLAFCWTPEKLRHLSQAAVTAKFTNVQNLIPMHQALVFAITFSIAQLPLEFLSPNSLKKKQRIKTMLVLAAAVSAYIAFYYSF